VLVLNKADLCEDLPPKIAQAERVAGDAPVVVVSAKTCAGLDHLRALIQPGETIVFMGSSGVGKSTLINDLCGEEVQATAEVRARDAKGRHTTSWRELISAPQRRPGHRYTGNGASSRCGWPMRAYAKPLTIWMPWRSTAILRDCTHTAEQELRPSRGPAAGQLSPRTLSKLSQTPERTAYLAQAQTKTRLASTQRQSRAAQRACNKSKRD